MRAVRTGSGRRIVLSARALAAPDRGAFGERKR